MAERKSVPLRIHPRLYDALRRWAEDDFRSVNGQIEWLCHEALQRAGRLSTPSAPATAGPSDASTTDSDEDDEAAEGGSETDKS